MSKVIVTSMFNTKQTMPKQSDLVNKHQKQNICEKYQYVLTLCSEPEFS